MDWIMLSWRPVWGVDRFVENSIGTDDGKEVKTGSVEEEEK